MRFVDLSVPFSESTPRPASFPPTTIDFYMTLERNGYSNESVSAPVHCGTHVDAPIHMVIGGASVERLPLDLFFRPGVVAHVGSLVNPGEPIEADHLRAALGDVAAEIGGSILGVHTGWLAGHFHDANFYGGGPFLGHSAIEMILETGVVGVAVDSEVDRIPGLPYPPPDDFPAHRQLLGAGVLIFENVANMEALPARGFTFCAFPVPLVGGDGGATRAVALFADDA